MHLQDRTEAGQKLAESLNKYSDKELVVLAIPRGGVPIAAAIAKALYAPLDLLFVRKIAHPKDPEYAIAAITEGGEMVLNKMEVKHVNHEWFMAELDKQLKVMAKRRKLYLGNRKSLSLNSKVIVIVDDGLATGLTMKAAVHEAQKQQPEKVIVAIPIASQEAAEELSGAADEVISLYTAYHFGSVSSYYEDFPQLTDQEVAEIIEGFN